jgi:hypothetical protein
MKIGSKLKKIKTLSFPFICFHLFFGIWAFQWVTRDSNTFFLTLRLRAPLCAPVLTGAVFG